MTNDTRHTDYEQPDDELLNRLVRAAARREHDQVAWPRPDSVLAYLGGQETDAQRAEIQDTLAHSPAFRRFLIDTAGDVEVIAAPEMVEKFNAVPVPRHLLNGESDAGETFAMRFRSWLSRLFRPPVLAPVLAVTAVIAIAIITDPLGVFRPQPQALAVYKEVDPGWFVRTTDKGPGGEVETQAAAASAFDAAMASMPACIQYDIPSNRFEMAPTASSAALDAHGRGLVLKLRDDAGNQLARLTAPIPTEGIDNVEAWIIAPPDMRLWHVAMPSDAADVPWQAGVSTGTVGCVTFTYRTDDGYRATPCQVFKF
jgi:hypothetical protein